MSQTTTALNTQKQYLSEARHSGLCEIDGVFKCVIVCLCSSFCVSVCPSRCKPESRLLIGLISLPNLRGRGGSAVWQPGTARLPVSFC